MVDYFRSTLHSVQDKIGDGVIYVMDEVKFWGEVLAEFLEIDQNSSDRHLMEVR